MTRLAAVALAAAAGLLLAGCDDDCGFGRGPSAEPVAEMRAWPCDAALRAELARVEASGDVARLVGVDAMRCFHGASPEHVRLDVTQALAILAAAERVAASDVGALLDAPPAAPPPPVRPWDAASEAAAVARETTALREATLRAVVRRELDRLAEARREAPACRAHRRAVLDDVDAHLRDARLRRAAAHALGEP